MYMLPGSVGVACSPILSVSLEGMGCKPVLNLAATPNETASIICASVDKTIPSTFGLGHVWSYTTDQPKAFCRCSSFKWSLGSLTWLTYAYGMLCQDDVTPGEFYSSNTYADTNL
jgi:hypothetical protein